jgi:hypothetical protein
MRGFENFDIGCWTEDGLVVRPVASRPYSLVRRASKAAAGLFASTALAVTALSATAADSRAEVRVTPAVATEALVLPVDAPFSPLGATGEADDTVGPTYWRDLMAAMATWKPVEENPTPQPDPVL